MANDLLDALRAHCRRRPLDQLQRDRIAQHMRACGISAIREGGLMFELAERRLTVLKPPATASDEPSLV